MATWGSDRSGRLTGEEGRGPSRQHVSGAPAARWSDRAFVAACVALLVAFCCVMWRASVGVAAETDGQVVGEVSSTAFYDKTAGGNEGGDSSLSVASVDENQDATGSEDDPDAGIMPYADESTYNPDAEPIVIGDGSKSTVTVTLKKGDTTFDPATGSVTLDDVLSGEIKIVFDTSELPTLEHPNISYKFPDNVTVTDVPESDLHDSAGNVSGTWSITDGVVTLKYSESWLTSHLSDISAYVDFDFQLDADQYKSQNQASVNFPGTGETITIKIDEGNVTGSKSVDFDDSGNATFTIYLSNAHDATGFTLTDVMGSNLSFVDGSFALDGVSQSVTVSGQTATLALDRLAAGSHTITYKATLTEAARATLAAGGELSEAGNTATWSWTGHENGGTGKTDNPSWYKYNMISKGASSQSDGSILWTVTLNSGNIKADMGGYTFTDTLGDGHSYTGTYEIVDCTTWQTTYSGSLSDLTSSDGTSFTYTFPEDAGQKQYLIKYYTKLENPDSTETVSNTGEIKGDEGEPSGTATGSYTPTDTTVYVTKEIEENNSATDGTVKWSSLVKFSEMSANTDVTKIVFNDQFSSSPYNSTFKFDTTVRPVLTIDGTETTLVENTDYVVSNFTDSQIQITFKDSETVKGLVSGTSNVKVSYVTTCDGSAGTYTNTAQLSIDGITTQATADYTIEKTNFVEKSGEVAWDATYDWGDGGAKGAWIATWTVTVNEDDSPYNNAGEYDVQGEPITVTDTLPDGMMYVSGSASAEVSAGWYPGTQQPTVSVKMTVRRSALRFRRAESLKATTRAAPS